MLLKTFNSYSIFRTKLFVIHLNVVNKMYEQATCCITNKVIFMSFFPFENLYSGGRIQDFIDVHMNPLLAMNVYTMLSDMCIKIVALILNWEIESILDMRAKEIAVNLEIELKVKHIESTFEATKCYCSYLEN